MEGRGGDSKTHSTWTEITNAESKSEFWDLLHRLDPKSAACSFGQLSKYADWKFADHPADYESPDGIEFPGNNVDGRSDWLAQSSIGSGQPPVGK